MKLKMAFIITLGLIFFVSCSTVKKILETSKSIPAANGQVQAKAEDNGNTDLDLKVKYMAPASKIRQGASQYVVWVRPGEGTQAVAQNIGVLLIDDQLEGNLKTLTPLRSFNLFITAEHSAQVSEPSGEELMWTNFAPGTL